MEHDLVWVVHRGLLAPRRQRPTGRGRVRPFARPRSRSDARLEELGASGGTVMSRRRRTESHNTPGVRGHEVFLGPSTGCGVGAGHSAPWAQTGRGVQRLEPLNGPAAPVGVRERVARGGGGDGGRVVGSRPASPVAGRCGLTPNRPPIRDGWRCGPVASRSLCVRRRRDHGQVPVAWVLFKGRREGAR